MQLARDLISEDLLRRTGERAHDALESIAHLNAAPPGAAFGKPPPARRYVPDHHAPGRPSATDQVRELDEKDRAVVTAAVRIIILRSEPLRFAYLDGWLPTTGVLTRTGDLPAPGPLTASRASPAAPHGVTRTVR